MEHLPSKKSNVNWTASRTFMIKVKYNGFGFSSTDLRHTRVKSSPVWTESDSRTSAQVSGVGCSIVLIIIITSIVISDLPLLCKRVRPKSRLQAQTSRLIKHKKAARGFIWIFISSNYLCICCIAWSSFYQAGTWSEIKLSNQLIILHCLQQTFVLSYTFWFCRTTMELQ